MCEVATWTLSTSFMMDDISWPVEWDSKNSAPCFTTLSKTRVAQVRDGGETRRS
jgi:hypothetical protein